jgi:hypothetical protein
MVLLAMFWRDSTHAALRMPELTTTLDYYFVPAQAGSMAVG